jgi:hypothetical protein
MKRTGTGENVDVAIISIYEDNSITIDTYRIKRTFLM